MLGLYYILSLFGLIRDTAKVVETEASIIEASKIEIPSSEVLRAKASSEMVKTDSAAAEAEAAELAKVEVNANELPKSEAAATEHVKAETLALYSSTREATVSYLTLATTYLASFTLAQLVLKVGLTAYSSCSHSSFALIKALFLHSSSSSSCIPVATSPPAGLRIRPGDCTQPSEAGADHVLQGRCCHSEGECFSGNRFSFR